MGQGIDQNAQTNAFRFRVKAMSNDGEHFAASVLTQRYLTGRLALVISRDGSLTSDGQTIETTVGKLVRGKTRYTVTREKAPEEN